MNAGLVKILGPFDGEFELYSIESEVVRLREWILFVDSRVDAIYDLKEKYPQCDDLPGYQQDMIVEDTVNDAEFEVGIGFVVCQKFLTSVYGLYSLEKTTALDVGPRHSEKYTKAQLVNHAANYWKHRDEWDLERDTRGRSQLSQMIVATKLNIARYVVARRS